MLGILRELAKVWGAAASPGEGETVATPAPPVPPIVTEPSEALVLNLRDIVPEWKALNRAKPNAVQRTERALKLFEEAVGVVPLARLDRPPSMLSNPDRSLRPKREPGRGQGDAPHVPRYLRGAACTGGGVNPEGIQAPGAFKRTDDSEIGAPVP